jgi:ankyrin repeat protein
MNAARPLDPLKNCLAEDNLAGATEILAGQEDAIERMKAGDCSAVAQLLGAVRSPAMADLLLEHGLTPASIGQWWASGFGLSQLPARVAEHWIERGAPLSVHAAAALGLTSHLRALLDRDPAMLHAKGGDGGRPLHFCRNVETARLLVERGAELDPPDDDHDSTPAQWRIGDAPEVTQYLLEQGARPDIFMAAGLNDVALARKLIEDDPNCVTYRIGHNDGPFPGIGFGGRGGTIYQWTLGFNLSPHEVARHRGDRDLFNLLWARSPARTRLLVACMLADRAAAEQLTRENPGLIARLSENDLALLAKCCWETNRNRDAVQLMLDLGFPLHVPERNHGFLALHNAAWCGDAALVELLLQRGHPVDQRDPTYHSTALGFALHSCVVARRHPDGDFPRVVEMLLDAGVPLEEKQFPSGDPAVDAVIERWRSRRSHDPA